MGLAVLFEQMVSVNSILKKLLNVHTMTAAFLNVGISECYFELFQWLTAHFGLPWLSDKYPQDFEGFIYCKKGNCMYQSIPYRAVCPV